MKEMLNIIAGDNSRVNHRMDHAKPEHAKASGETVLFGDEVKKFSEPEESGKPEALGNAHAHKALGRNEHNKTQRGADSERSLAEESLVNTYMNKALNAETNESKPGYDGAASEANEFADKVNTYINMVSHGETNETPVNHNEAAVTLNVQEFSSDVIDKAENFISTHSNAVQEPQTQTLSPESSEAVSADAAEQVDHEAFRVQAREILHKSVLWTSGELLLEETAAHKPVLNKKSVSEEPPLNAPSEPESKIHVLPAREMPIVIEKIAKILEIMAVNGESFHDFIKENQGSVAAALLDKYDLWEKSQTEQEQSPAVSLTYNSAVSLNESANVNAADSLAVNANTNEKLTGYIPQAKDPAELGMSGSQIKWTDDNELAPAVEQKGSSEQKTAANTVDQTKIISQQKAAADFTPVDSQTMRAMYKQEIESVSASEKESNPTAVNTSHSQQNTKPAAFDGVQIPVSYTELSSANTNAAQQINVQPNLTAENSVQPVQHNESFSQPADTVNVTSATILFNDLTHLGAPADAEASDPQDTIQLNTQANAAKAVDAAEKALSSLSRVDQQAIIDQISEKLQIAVRNGVHEMRITLRPQELGEVRMNIRVEGDQVTARMLVESEQVKAIVEKHFQQLKDSLEQQNLHAAKLSVDVGTDADRRQLWQEMTAMANMRRSQNGNENGEEGASEQDDNFVTAFGTDTGRRYGNNTFELFV